MWFILFYLVYPILYGLFCFMRYIWRWKCLQTAILVPHFQRYKYIHKFRSVNTIGDKPDTHKISYDDFSSNSRFVWRLTNTGVTLDTAASFSYYDVDLNIPYLGSASDSQSDHQYAAQVIESHPNKLQIFTDGSVRGPKQQRTVGSGYVILSEDSQVTGMYSPATTSIAMAEFSAIDKALQHLETLSKY